PDTFRQECPPGPCESNKNASSPNLEAQTVRFFCPNGLIDPDVSRYCYPIIPAAYLQDLQALVTQWDTFVTTWQQNWNEVYDDRTECLNNAQNQIEIDYCCSVAETVWCNLNEQRIQKVGDLNIAAIQALIYAQEQLALCMNNYDGCVTNRNDLGCGYTPPFPGENPWGTTFSGTPVVPECQDPPPTYLECKSDALDDYDACGQAALETAYNTWSYNASEYAVYEVRQYIIAKACIQNATTQEEVDECCQTYQDNVSQSYQTYVAAQASVSTTYNDSIGNCQTAFTQAMNACCNE
ncbi:MAG: hypothetical protein ACXABY_14590, partial [Candidatus Thorarchaeota archaeon]